MNDRFALLIDINDNVATLLDESFPNDKIQVKTKEGKIFDQIILIEQVKAGHKIALRDLDAGEIVIKYGETIGKTTKKIPRGAWVHVHNVKSLRGRGDLLG